MAEPLRVLLTGVGAPGTRGTLYALRENPERRAVRVVGVDGRADAVGRHFVEAFAQVPFPEDGAYAERLLAVCDQHQIDLVIPQTTRETAVLAGLKDRFEAAGSRVMVAEPEAIAIANHKGRLLRLFEELDLPRPAYQVVHSERQLRDAASSLGYPEQPVVVKPPVANGMRGFRILREGAWDVRRFLAEKPSGTEISLEELVAILGRGGPWPQLLVTEYLPGPEYTVDAFLGHNGGITIVRLRSAIVGGISAQTVLEERPDLDRYTLQSGAALGLRYAFGFQYKMDAAGRPKLLECNPRVQGTMVAGLFGGVNIVWLAVQEALGASPIMPDSARVGASFQRFWSGVGLASDGPHEI